MGVLLSWEYYLSSTSDGRDDAYAVNAVGICATTETNIKEHFFFALICIEKMVLRALFIKHSKVNCLLQTLILKNFTGDSFGIYIWLF